MYLDNYAKTIYKKMYFFSGVKVFANQIELFDTFNKNHWQSSFNKKKKIIII